MKGILMALAIILGTSAYVLLNGYPEPFCLIVGIMCGMAGMYLTASGLRRER